MWYAGIYRIYEREVRWHGIHKRTIVHYKCIQKVWFKKDSICFWYEYKWKCAKNYIILFRYVWRPSFVKLIDLRVPCKGLIGLTVWRCITIFTKVESFNTYFYYRRYINLCQWYLKRYLPRTSYTFTVKTCLHVLLTIELQCSLLFLCLLHSKLLLYVLKYPSS